MAAYAIRGTPVPDAKTENTGEPAGTFEGRNYWAWVSGGKTWYLFSVLGYWLISEVMSTEIGTANYWVSVQESVTPVCAEYTAHNGIVGPNPAYSGDVSVSVADTPASVYFMLEITTGPAAGKYVGYKVG